MAWHAGLLTVWLVAQVAAADAPWESRVERGIALRLAGHEEEALAIFRDAEKERTSPRFLAQMAFTEQSLGLWVAAEAHLAQALSSPDDAWIAKNRGVLLGARDTIREHLGSLELRGDVRGELRVDGRPVGALPSKAPVRLEVGRHRIEVSRPGAYSFQRDVDVRANETSRETVTLSEIPASDGAQPVSGAHVPGRVAIGGAEPQASTTSSSPSRTVGIVLVSVGIAAVATGLATLLVSNARAKDYNDNADCRGKPTDPLACDSDASAARAFRTVSIASFVGAGVAGLTGAYLLWRSSQTATPTSVRTVISDEGIGFVLRRAY
jgi:hypothetical protein